MTNTSTYSASNCSVSKIHISLFSETAQEHINKFLIAFQLQHCRQSDYKLRNTDLVNRCLEQSDPLVLESFERANPSGPIKPYPREVRALCKDSDEILKSMLVNE